MEKPNKNSDTSQTVKSTLMFSEHARVSAMVAVITILSIGLIAGGGYLLDQQFDTGPLFLIIGMVASFPLSQLIIFRWVKKNYVPRLQKKSSSKSNHS